LQYFERSFAPHVPEHAQYQMSILPENVFDGLLETIVTDQPHPTLTHRPLGAVLLESGLGGLGEFKEICWQYLHKLPLGIQLGQISCSDEPLQNLKNFEFDCRLFLDGAPIGQLMVALYHPTGADPDEVYVELEQGQIWLQEWRGKGLGKAIAKMVLELGKALGARSITAFAMYDGRFVWSNLGFKFGDYLPEQEKARKYQRAFRSFCRRHGVTPPSTAELRHWNAPDFARFDPGVRVPAYLGHRHDRHQKLVPLGMAFLISRRPFFLCFPLE
jgi:hypothetical protein